jgi:hypothetical protein
MKIRLLNTNNALVKEYDSPILPSVNDNIVLSHNSVFVVKQRVLSTENDNVVLSGYVELIK